MLTRVRDLPGELLRRPRDAGAAPPAPQAALTTDLLRLQVSAGATDALGGISGALSSTGHDLSDRCVRAVRVAAEVGAPLLDAIDAVAAAEDDVRQARRATAVASAQTRTVAGALLVAPFLLVPGLGRLIGADLVGFYRSRIGFAVLAVGLALLATGASIIVWLVRRVAQPVHGGRQAGAVALVSAAAAGWLAWRAVGPALVPVTALLVHRLAARRRPPVVDAGLDEAVDLAATALAAGVSIPQSLRLAANALPELSDPLRRVAFDLEFGSLDRREAAAADAATTRVNGLQRFVVVLQTAASVGAPVVPTLRRLARDLRADDLARRLAAAERLPAQLTFPTALCLLPATVLLIGAPIVHAGLAGAGT